MSYEHIDAARMTALARELAGDVVACLRFIDDFLRAWDQRRTRVLHAVDASGPIDDALAALLTLATSSAMVGAESLSTAARELHSEARSLGSVPSRGADRLARIGAASCEELQHAAQGWRLAG
jgi:HPt (histidine-containing phosphotransfer) domain-containing protein